MVHKVIISGFSYSGSSALFDFLADYKGVTVFPCGEFRMFRASHGLKLLFSEFRQTQKLSAETISNFTRFCEGNGACLTDLDHLGNKNILRMKKYFGEFFDLQARELITEISATGLVKERFLGAIRKFLTAICDEVGRRENASIILMDQALRPWTMGYIPCFDDATVFIVRRDLRDQIVDRIKHGYPKDAGFIDQMASRIASAERSIHKFGTRANYRFNKMWFEDFIHDNGGVRGNILSQMGLSGRNDAGEPKFDPSKSVRNIGIYKKDEALLPDLKKAKRLFYQSGEPAGYSAISVFKDFHLPRIIRRLKDVFGQKRKLAAENRKTLAKKLRNNGGTTKTGVIWFKTKYAAADRQALYSYRTIEIVSSKHPELSPGVYKIQKAVFDEMKGKYKIHFLVNDSRFKRELEKNSVTFRLLAS